MSTGTDPTIPRPRDLDVEFYRLHLMMLLNQLRQEILLYKTQRRNFFTSIFVSEKQLRREHELEANSIQDRKRLLLETAKNLLYDPGDPEQAEYKLFEELANELLSVKVMHSRWYGFRWKEMQ